MIVPAQRAQQHRPDLLELRRQYDALPPVHIRWRTQQGQDFLDLLNEAMASHTCIAVARALGRSSSGITYMQRQRQRTRLISWPTENDLRALRRAWRAVERRPIAPQSPQYAHMHKALIALLEKGFAIEDIAWMMELRPRQLNRFRQSPMMSSSGAIARAIHALYPAK